MTDLSPIEQPNRSGSPALLIACASLFLSLIACGVVRFGSDDLLPVQSEPLVASASELEAAAHVTLPPGTVLLSAASSNGLETMVSAKFRLPRSELDAFVDAGTFTAPVTPGLRAVDDVHNVGGGDLWDPGTAKTVSGIEEEEPTSDGTRRSVLFNLDAPGTVTVYLYAVRG